MSEMESTDSSKITDENIDVTERMSALSTEKVYEYFSLHAWNLKEVVKSFEVLKNKLGLSKKSGLDLYTGLKLTLGSPSSKAWKAREVLNMLDKRANQKEYMRQKAATGVKVFIVGAGPVGLRLAIDCMLLGAEAVIVEKRQAFSRNNVLHLWPFTIEDLRQLGAKKFYGKFCAGAIDHISIRSLQCILLKVALLLGVKIYTGIEFQEIQEPDAQIGWHAKLNPSDHPLNLYEFNILVGTDGARKSKVPGFDRKELRGKLALAITANFKNYFTRDEVAVQEISGVAFIFNQKFFKDLKEDTDIDLENIVYYKDDTHYFVMTAKKDSLLRKGVLRSDCSDTYHLLHPNNIDMESLYDYSREAAGWCTELPKLDFAVNHRDNNDVALFDFTSIHQAEYAAQAISRGGKDLYLCVAGDALLEPFWPTGTGIGRGFLSAMDTAWLIKRIGERKPVLEVLCERESVFQRLPQTTPESLVTNIKNYTIDPKSRYPNLNFHRMQPNHMVHLYDTDDSYPSPALRQGSIKVKRSAEAAGVTVSASPLEEKIEEEDKENTNPIPMEKKRRQDAESLSLGAVTSPKRKSLRSRGSIHLAYYAEPEEVRTLKDPTVLLTWLQKEVEGYGDIKVTNLTTSWSNGMALCAIIHRYHPELITNFKQLSHKNSEENNELAFSIAEEHLGISRLLKPKEMKKPDKLTLLSYLSLFYELFRDAEPAPPTSDEDVEPMSTEVPALASTPADGGRGRDEGGSVGDAEDVLSSTKKRKKSFLSRRKSKKKLLGASPSSGDRSWNTKSVTRETTPTSPQGKSLVPPTALHTIQEKPSPNSTPKITRGGNKKPTTLGFKAPTADSSDFCYFCDKRVYLMERMSANGVFFHRSCFRCFHCKCQLKIGGYSLSKGVGDEKGKFFCSAHYRQLFLSNPEAINYSRAGAGGGGGGAKAKSEKMENICDKKNSSSPVLTAHESKTAALSPVRINIKQSPDRETTPMTSTDEEMLGTSSGGGSEGEKVGKKRSKSKFRLRGLSRGKKSSSRSRSSSVEDVMQSSEASEEGHRVVVQTPQSGEYKKMSPMDTASASPSRASTEDEMEVSPSIRLRSRTTLVPTKSKPSGLVQRMSHGFEKLEANARDTEIQLGEEGREKAKSMLFRMPSGPITQPFEMPSSSLSVIRETNGGGKGPTSMSPRSIRAKSPARWSGSLQNSRLPPEEVEGIQRSSRSILKRPHRNGRGQQSVSRPLIDNYDTSDVAIQERRKQQRRFRDAQLIQREMSQLERQYDELEEVGREIEQALRDAEDTKQEGGLMKSWLGLVNERNGLVRKTSELSLRMKELELEDRQYEIDKKLSALSNVPDGYELTKEEMEQFEELCKQKIAIVEERDVLVNQVEEERLRELEEDGLTQGILDDKYNEEGYDNIPTDDDDDIVRRASIPAKSSSNNGLLEKEKAQNKRKSWWPSFGKS